MAPSAMSSMAVGSQAWERMLSLWDEDDYQTVNLEDNNVELASFGAEPPYVVKDVLDHMEPSQAPISRSESHALQNINFDHLHYGARDEAFQVYFREHVIATVANFFIMTIRNIMPRETLPARNSYCPLATPSPDLLISYDTAHAFSKEMRNNLETLGHHGLGMTSHVMFPFFSIEFERAGLLGPGSMMAATNRCAGNAVSCVTMMENLTQKIRQFIPCFEPLNSMAFSVACNGVEARIFATAKEAGHFRIYLVKILALTNQEQHVTFRRYINRILTWALGPRMLSIISGVSSLVQARKYRDRAQPVQPGNLFPRGLWPRAWTGNDVSDDESSHSPSAPPPDRSWISQQAQVPTRHFVTCTRLGNGLVVEDCCPWDDLTGILQRLRQEQNLFGPPQDPNAVFIGPVRQCGRGRRAPSRENIVPASQSGHAAHWTAREQEASASSKGSVVETRYNAIDNGGISGLSTDNEPVPPLESSTSVADPIGNKRKRKASSPLEMAPETGPYKTPRVQVSIWSGPDGKGPDW